MSDTSINRTREIAGGGNSGGLWLLIFFAMLAVVIAAPFLLGVRAVAVSIPLGIIAFFTLCGFYAIQPKQAVAVTLFGNYKGTDRTTGLRWVPFWYGRKKVSMRVRNVTSETLKVNDQRGNPVEIAANIVWHVADSAQALFDVDDYVAFVNIQIETALRETARQYAYDHADDGEPTLRDDAEIVGERLKADLMARVEVCLPRPYRLRCRLLVRAGGAAGAGRPGDRRARPRQPAAQPLRRRGPGRAQGGHGVQPAGGAVRRPRGPAGGQYRHALLSHGVAG
ncbi:MAG: hypothetical protein JF615_11525 [Asticcacaulis sp.]|nr:hypothetical protein [Asticcacaulis sp.]